MIMFNLFNWLQHSVDDTKSAVENNLGKTMWNNDPTKPKKFRNLRNVNASTAKPFI